MNDEIKEIMILLNIKECCYIKLTNQESKLLLDYITNLQEELESKNKEIKDLKNRLYAITTKFN